MIERPLGMRRTSGGEIDTFARLGDDLYFHVL